MRSTHERANFVKESPGAFPLSRPRRSETTKSASAKNSAVPTQQFIKISTEFNIKQSARARARNPKKELGRVYFSQVRVLAPLICIFIRPRAFLPDACIIQPAILLALRPNLARSGRANFASG